MRTAVRVATHPGGAVRSPRSLRAVPNPADAGPVDAPRDRRGFVWAKRLALVVVLVLAGYAVYRNYEALRDDLDRLSPWVLVASFVPAALAMLASLQVWRTLMAE